MIEVNLLPKDYRKGGRGLSLGKSGIYIMAAAAGVVVVLIAITFYQMSQLSDLKTKIEQANQRASLLRQDIRLVDALMDVKQKIHDRIDAVEKLDRHRSAWVRILEDVSRNTPEFVWLDKFEEVEQGKLAAKNDKEGKQKDKNDEAVEEPAENPSVRPVKVCGYAFTLNALAATMIKMMRSDYFDNVELIESKDTVYAGEKAYKFELSANVHYLSDEELRNLANKTDTENQGSAKHASLN